MGVVPASKTQAGWKKRRSVRSIQESFVRLACFLCAAASVVVTFGIIFVLSKETWVFFQRVSPVEYFTGTEWSPTIRPEKYGVLPLISGTLLITIGAGIIAVPLGLMAGVYLSEYASPRIRNFLKPGLELLAGIPTVVYGYFAVFFVTPLLRKFFDVEVFNAASGAIVVGIMILPLVSSLCEEALRAVPKSLREAAYGMGSTKLEVTLKVVLPAALSGVMASFILALSRAIGETMAVTLAAGSTPRMTLNPAESIQTMTAFIVQISRGDTPAGTTPYYTLFAVALTIFVMTLAMNMAASMLVKRFRQVYH